MNLLFAVCGVMVVAWVSPVSAQLSEAPANQDPEWIWGSSDRHQSRTVVMTRMFSCDAAIVEAQLRLAADFTSCSVALNGRTVATVDDYGPMLNLEVADALKLGANTMEVTAKNQYGPPAVAVSLQIRFVDDSVQRIVSNARWKTRTGTGTTESQADVATVSLGRVDSRFWINPDRSRISAFDDYTQWKLAGTDSSAPHRPAVITQPGFEFDLLRAAKPDEGSWVSMAFDPLGRITIAREDKGLLRLTLGAEGHPERMEVINDSLQECRGLLYAYGDLYANANNSRGLYRLHDADDDDRFEDVQLLRQFPGGVGHGRNDLALGPDGLIYSIHGDAVELPQADIRDRTSPFRDGLLDRPHAQGHLVRTDREGRHWELVATGLRNPFGIDFNHDGELFTYDADAEYDMGAPWYRPTRIDQLVSGADFGWRGLTKHWPPYELDLAGNALPTATVGKGSPTAVKFGYAATFPRKWRDALYVLDWAYGRVVACHLFPRGAGYVCRCEDFLKGRPLNVTDLDFGPDGAMYLITGGRRTESALYRVRWSGKTDAGTRNSSQQLARAEFSAEQRRVRAMLENYHAPATPSDAVDTIWPHLSSPDPVIRHAARVALEHQDSVRWQQRALDEADSSTAAVALLALARSNTPALRTAVVSALNRLDVRSLSVFDRLTILHAYSICLKSTSKPDADVLKEAQRHLTSWLSAETQDVAHRYGPTGAGRSVVAVLAGLVSGNDPNVAHKDIVQLLHASTRQEDRMHYLYLLRHAATDWETEDRAAYFEYLNDLQRTAMGGDGMPDFLRRIRESAVASLSVSEREQLNDSIRYTSQSQPPFVTAARPFVRDWSLADLDQLIPAGNSAANARGAQLFAAAQCDRCHRIGYRGGLVGPDLTNVGSRFSRRDILKSIVDPSRVVAEKYRNVQVVTVDGKSIVGRILPSGDYRSASITIATDPLDPSRVVTIMKTDVERHEESDLSPMPKGLLNTFTADEIAELLAYLSAAAPSLRADQRE